LLFNFKGDVECYPLEETPFRVKISSSIVESFLKPSKPSPAKSDVDRCKQFVDQIIGYLGRSDHQGFVIKLSLDGEKVFSFLWQSGLCELKQEKGGSTTQKNYPLSSLFSIHIGKKLGSRKKKNATNSFVKCLTDKLKSEHNTTLEDFFDSWFKLQIATHKTISREKQGVDATGYTELGLIDDR